MIWDELNNLNDWQNTLFPELNAIKPSIDRLGTLLTQNAGKFHPDINKVLKPFELSPSDIRVVIVGQDPYPCEKMATGLPFSTPSGENATSATNIFNAIINDTCPASAMPNDGNLEHWPPQGIFLLNRKFTLQHDSETRFAEEVDCKWLEFSATLIEILSQKKDKLIFLLWGKPAQRVASVIDKNKHCVLEAPHPTARGKHQTRFQTRHHFSKTNNFLLNTTKPEPIKWI